VSAGTPLPPPAATDRPWSPDAETEFHGGTHDAAVATHTPASGGLTAGWRLVTAVLWVCAVLAWAAVWNASVQLGLSTWWLGARGQPAPVPLRLIPFVIPVLAVLGAINGLRRLPWLGLAGAAVFAGYGVGDLGRVPRLATVELLVAAAVALVVLASFTGQYRAPRR